MKLVAGPHGDAPKGGTHHDHIRQIHLAVSLRSLHDGLRSAKGKDEESNLPVSPLSPTTEAPDMF